MTGNFATTECLFHVLLHLVVAGTGDFDERLLESISGNSLSLGLGHVEVLQKILMLATIQIKLSANFFDSSSNDLLLFVKLKIHRFVFTPVASLGRPSGFSAFCARLVTVVRQGPP